MEPEDGIIWLYGSADVEVPAATPFGVANIIKMIGPKPDRRARAATISDRW
jgi:hypothetical protein